jgi:hypothetical protein
MQTWLPPIVSVGRSVNHGYLLPIMENIKEIREAPVKHPKKITNPDHHYISTIYQNPIN